MKLRNYLALLVSTGVILSAFFSPSLAAQERTKREKAKDTKTIIIPQQVKKAFEEGMPTRQIRPEIPFTIIKHIYLPELPTKQNLHSIFFFQVKNADLGYESLISDAEKKKEEETQPLAESSPNMLQANSHIFLQFNKLENDTIGELVREVYIPVKLQVETSTYEANEEEIYSAGDILPPGHYLLSMAIASVDWKRIGTQYFEFSLPEEASLTNKIETTPLFFMGEMEQLPSPIKKATVNKGSFTYIFFQIGYIDEKSISSRDNLELLFYVFGAHPGEDGTYDIESNYEILKGEEKAIRYAPGIYNNPLIQQPLPLKKTVVVKYESGEKEESRDLEPGEYTLLIKITDKISGLTMEKKVDFVVK